MSREAWGFLCVRIYLQSFLTYFFFLLALVMPSWSILKRVKDLNLCMKAAKESNIDYKLFSVIKDEFTSFLPKRFEWEIIKRERDLLCLLTSGKGNHRKNLTSSTSYFQDWVPYFQFGTGTSLPVPGSSGRGFQGGPSGLSRPLNFTLTLHILTEGAQKSNSCLLLSTSLLWYPLFSTFFFCLLKPPELLC